MAQIDFVDVGYTPNNLRVLIKHLGMTQAEVANHLGVTPRTVRLWLANPETATQRDMPYKQWQKLLSMAND